MAAEVAARAADADLGGGVFKQCVARAGEGKSGGFRTIVLFRGGTHVFYVYGFAKNAKANISRSELAAFRKLANIFLSLDSIGFTIAVDGGELVKVGVDG
jgi:hypothetical protein